MRMVAYAHAHAHAYAYAYTYAYAYAYAYVCHIKNQLCDSSILGQNLDLVNSHFTTDRVMSFIFQQDITLYVGHHCWNFDKNQ